MAGEDELALLLSTISTPTEEIDLSLDQIHQILSLPPDSRLLKRQGHGARKELGQLPAKRPQVEIPSRLDNHWKFFIGKQNVNDLAVRCQHLSFGDFNEHL